MPKAPRTKINAVLFDLGKVILDFNFEPAFRRLSKASPFKPEEIRGFFTSSGLEVLYDGGKITSAEFFQEVKKGVKHSLTFSEFKKVWNEIFTPNPAVWRLIKKLSPRYRLVLISNTNAMHYEYIRERYSILKHFDRCILSFKVRVRKPDERIYKEAVRACKARPHEIFYIDDREDLTSAAKELGFNTFTFKNNPDDLIKAMRDLKIEKI